MKLRLDFVQTLVNKRFHLNIRLFIIFSLVTQENIRKQGRLLRILSHSEYAFIAFEEFL
jgi:hypothetical protein